MTCVFLFVFVMLSVLSHLTDLDEYRSLLMINLFGDNCFSKLLLNIQHIPNCFSPFKKYFIQRRFYDQSLYKRQEVI